MVDQSYQMQRIDHIEVNVPDRYEAAKWYEKVFGFKILQHPVFEWAVNLPNGPLFIGSEDWAVKVSLFEGEPQGQHPFIGFNRACFSLTGTDFLSFLDHMDALELYDEKGTRMTRNHLADHRFAWAVYFSDPYGNRYELTTYDYQQVADQLHAREAR